MSLVASRGQKTAAKSKSDDVLSRRGRPWGRPGVALGHPKSMKISSLILEWFFINFGCHSGSILGAFSCTFLLIFRLIFEVRFLMFFCGLGLPFQHHFGIQNRSREPSGAKRSTLDFERQYNENPAFSPWRVPGDTQNHIQNPLQKLITFCKDFRPRNYSKMAQQQLASAL